MIWILSLFLTLADAKSHAHKSADAKPFTTREHLTKVGSCPPVEGAKKVYVLKQWHLAPTTATKGFKEKYPQERNQTALFHVLEEGVKRQQLQLIVSEGCEGDIDENFKLAFNGWDFKTLKNQCQQRGYDKILTLLPLKIKAKYGDRIHVTCGDNLDLINEGNRHLSNLRGWTGFYVRLTEHGSPPEKIKMYQEAAAENLKVAKDTPLEKVIELVKGQLKEDLAAFQKSISDRNESFVQRLTKEDFTNAAVVIGGLHGEDLRLKLEAAHLNCEVLEPPGYQHEDEKLIEDFQHALL